MKTDDDSVKTTELVLKVIDYARDYNLNIENIDDVKHILRKLNTTISTDAEIREFMVLLIVTDKYFEMKAPQRNTEKKKMLN